MGILGDVAGVNERNLDRDYPHSGYQYIDISSVTAGVLADTTPYSLDSLRVVLEGWSNTETQYGLSSARNRKSYLYIHEPPDDIVVSTGFAVLSPKLICPEYLYLWVTAQQFINYRPATRAEVISW